VTIPLRTGNTKRNRLPIQVPLTPALLSITFLGLEALTGMESAFVTPSAHP
jgi:hypothetical protein